MQSHPKVIPLHGDCTAAPKSLCQTSRPTYCTDQEVEFLALYRDLDVQGRTEMRLMLAV